ncbi:MAG: hypothetical protein M3O36_10385 [Myxococcota bacterium]|nr:hypothetical protein [Myxococcota bacterium]
MPLALAQVASTLFEVFMAPLVLGGSVRPGHAIGARVALALGAQTAPELDQALAEQVAAARARAARALAPIDSVGPPTSAEWTLAAAFHDVLVASNPLFTAPLRRGAAERILELAETAIDRAPAVPTVGDALSRHAWFARMLEVTRNDTAVSWWLGSQTFLGVDAPPRLTYWPELRRVTIVRTPRSLLELAPLAVDRAHFVEAVARLLAKTPLTDLATCVRPEPEFAWSEATLALVGSRTGRTLAGRALARLPAVEVDATLGRATCDLLSRAPASLAEPALALLAERAMALVSRHLPAVAPHPARAEVTFAHAVGALAALRELASADDRWRDEEKCSLRLALAPLARMAATTSAHPQFEKAWRRVPRPTEQDP